MRSNGPRITASDSCYARRILGLATRYQQDCGGRYLAPRRWICEGRPVRLTRLGRCWQRCLQAERRLVWSRRAMPWPLGLSVLPWWRERASHVPAAEAQPVASRRLTDYAARGAGAPLSLCPSASASASASAPPPQFSSPANMAIAIAMAAMTAASISHHIASRCAETARLPLFRNCEAYGASSPVRGAT